MNTSMESDIRELHWMMGVLHSINVGIVVIDRDYKVTLWNDFMVNRSGKRADAAMGRNIFELFQEIPTNWFTRKIESVFTLGNRAFTTWEQRPYLMKFKNHRPITGVAEYMYQNITFIPLLGVDGNVNHVGIIIYDVTDMAVGKQALENANDELERLSRTDRLTELFNRGYWEECLANEFDRYRRTKQNTTLIMFDLDHFKNINDTYGHQAGDEVLRQTSRTLRRTIRKTDIAGRYGGEEFAIILVDTDIENALVLAERLRTRVETLKVTYGKQKIDFTVSLGLSQLEEAVPDYKTWLRQADQSLYFSKEHGRNQATVYSEEKMKALKSAG